MKYDPSTLPYPRPSAHCRRGRSEVQSLASPGKSPCNSAPNEITTLSKSKVFRCMSVVKKLKESMHVMMYLYTNAYTTHIVCCLICLKLDLSLASCTLCTRPPASEAQRAPSTGSFTEVFDLATNHARPAGNREHTACRPPRASRFLHRASFTQNWVGERVSCSARRVGEHQSLSLASLAKKNRYGQ